MYVFVCHVTLDIFRLLCSVLSLVRTLLPTLKPNRSISSPFYGLDLPFFFLFRFQSDCYWELSSGACNFSLSENHLQPRGQPCASLRLSTIFWGEICGFSTFTNRKLQKKEKKSSYEFLVIRANTRVADQQPFSQAFIPRTYLCLLICLHQHIAPHPPSPR